MLILVDDLGRSNPGCYGHAWHHTPNLDQLASEGMRFTNGYSPAPICCVIWQLPAVRRWC
ncbi:MAG: sulfatase-like hydrolase/transferase [Planctomycetaceae bacterium]